jgi:hypothetical protein
MKTEVIIYNNGFGQVYNTTNFGNNVIVITQE